MHIHGFGDFAIYEDTRNDEFIDSRFRNRSLQIDFKIPENVGMLRLFGKDMTAITCKIYTQ